MMNLGENDTQYRELLQNLQVAVYTTDKEGRITFYNRAAAALWGREPQIGKDLWCGSFKIFHSDGSLMAADTAPIAVCLKEVRPVYDEEIVLARPDGSLRHVAANTQPLFNHSGEMIGAINMLIDITQTKRIEQELRESEAKNRELAPSLEKNVEAQIVNLKRRNEELQQSEERYHKMIEEVEDYAIILLDKDGIIQNWNKGAQKIKGYQEHEIIGKSFSNFYLPEDRAKGLPQTLLNQARESGKAIHEGWRMRKDGSRFWGSIVITRLQDHKNNIVGFSKVTRDLTERKIAEDRMTEYTLDLNRRNEELQQSEERYHKMVEEVEDYAIILLDQDGIVQNWNKGAEKIKGYQANEIVGKSFSTFYLPEDRASGLPQTLLKEATESGKAIHEGWRMRKDGSHFWGSIVLTSLHDNQNNLIGFSKVTRDLTERKMAEDRMKEYTLHLTRRNEELQRSEERYHKMVEEVEDYAIILLDKDGLIQNWNKGAEKIKGYQENEIVGKSFSTFYLPEDRESGLPQRLLNQARESGKAIHEGWRMRKDGSRFWGSIVLTSLHDNKNNVIGFSKVTRDLTEKKITEDRLREYTDQLEFQNRELEQFAYAASHDMKEPLRKIELYNSYIFENPANILDEQSRDFLSRSVKAVTRMTGLIEDLLAYSRTTNNLENFEKVDLNEIVEEVKQMHKEECEKIDVNFEVQQLPAIYAIPFQIKQLMFNLINNSIKYRQPEGKLSIQIKSERVKGSEIYQADAEPYLSYQKISVIDNGVGFEPQFSEKIFKIFHRLSNHPSKGSGIGLAICKRIVQNHHGFIKATSEKDEGARFDIFFPTTYEALLLQ